MKTQRTIDFNKVQWADYWWQNQDGAKSRTKPLGISVHSCLIEPDKPAMYYWKFPNETNLERATRLGIIDKWHPVCVLTVSANRTLVYKGEAATKIWKNYNAHIYGKR